MVARFSHSSTWRYFIEESSSLLDKILNLSVHFVDLIYSLARKTKLCYVTQIIYPNMIVFDYIWYLFPSKLSDFIDIVKLLDSIQ